MAVLFCDSFDHFTTALDKWTSATAESNNNFFRAGAGGRNGTNCLQTFALGTNGAGQLNKTLPGGSKTTVIVGFAFQRPNVGQGGLNVLQFLEGTTAPPALVEQVRLELNTALGVLRVMRGATVLGQGSSVIPNASYVYIELKVTCDPTVGAVRLRINGKDELNLTGINTRGASISNIDSISLWSDGVGNTTTQTTYDDFYICDTLGTYNNDFLGDIRIQALMPTGVGSGVDAWTPNAAGANWTKVSEIPHDSDTTYLTTATVNARDSYQTADLSVATGNVLAVQTVLVARKEDAGTRSIQPILRQGGVDRNVGGAANIAVSYSAYLSVAETSPATGIPFTIAEVNAAEIGLKLAT